MTHPIQTWGISLPFGVCYSRYLPSFLVTACHWFCRNTCILGLALLETFGNSSEKIKQAKVFCFSQSRMIMGAARHFAGTDTGYASINTVSYSLRSQKTLYLKVSPAEINFHFIDCFSTPVLTCAL